MLDTDQHAPQFGVAVGPSVAVELEWVLAAAGREDWRRDHPTLSAAYGADPGLARRVTEMWGPDTAMSCAGFMEVLVLAHRGGVLLSDDPAELLGRLDELCRLPVDPAAYPFLSETADDRRVILERLARLRRSAAVRARYVALLRDVWAAVAGDWERLGRRAVDAAVAARRASWARDRDWREVTRSECDTTEMLPGILAALGVGGELVVVPAFFTHKGLLLDLPGTVLVGVRVDTSGAEARARTELLARRLKALADPTRLAILDSLRRAPRSVTELATLFGVAQPTVSNHVRVLRAAGLVADERQGTRRALVVRPEAAGELVAGLGDVLTPAHGSHPSPAHGSHPSPAPG